MELRSLELKVPPVIVFLVALIAVFGASKVTDSGMLIDDRFYAKLTASVLGVIGAAIGIIAVITFRRAKTTVNPVNIENASSLVTHGIFHYSRNPMYVGLVLILLASGFYLSANIFLTLLIVLGFVTYMNKFQIKPEERMLTRLFGDTYLAYMQKTRPWI